MPRLKHMMKGIALAAALMAANASTTSAFGFNAEGFQTGMTVDQVAAVVGAQGLTLDPFDKYGGTSLRGLIDQVILKRADPLLP
jgi:hypothetical protein